MFYYGELVANFGDDMGAKLSANKQTKLERTKY